MSSLSYCLASHNFHVSEKVCWGLNEGGLESYIISELSGISQNPQILKKIY